MPTGTLEMGARVRQTDSRSAARGLMLVEVLVALGVIGLLATISVFGLGALKSARLRESAVLVASAIKTGYSHANATSKTVRVVLDFEKRTVALEESSSKLALRKNDLAGGALPATEVEKRAQAEGESLMKGPVAPRAQFSPAKAALVKGDTAKGRELSRGIRVLQVETDHIEEPVTEGRAYVYCWPGGLTQPSAVQLAFEDDDSEQATVTVLVSPLTGRTKIKRGRVPLSRPENDEQASERETF